MFPVSIPFIAGQWSLRGKVLDLSIRRKMSQSPSLRGSGRFCAVCAAQHWDFSKSQSPSLRGSGRFCWVCEMTQRQAYCLNPLHCGAVVASVLRVIWSIAAVASQSPSLRGSGRFAFHERTRAMTDRTSQSPSLRGSGRFPCPPYGGRSGKRVSIPFIAGQWSLPSHERSG